MNIGMNIFNGVSFENQVKYFKQFNIDRTFLASETPDFDNVLKLFKENGIICETLHAPFDRINDMWSEDETAGAEMLDRLKDSIDKCCANGIPVTVVHVSSGRPMPEITRRGMERFDELFAYAERKGITIALENLRYVENLLLLAETHEDAGFCWDCGHENCYTDGINFTKIFKGKIVALHIADNSCVPDSDDHFLPYDGKIDFENVAKLLAESGYDGTLMLEIGRVGHGIGSDIYQNMSDEEYVRRAADAARKLADRVEVLSSNYR